MSELEKTIESLKYDEKGLIPVIVVDSETKRVVMMAYMNATSLLETVRTGKTHFWSRSRQKYWMKGEQSGHTQDVRNIFIDCDSDTVLIEATQHEAACHEGYFSCFFRRLTDSGKWEIVDEKVFDPSDVYKKTE